MVGREGFEPTIRSTSPIYSRGSSHCSTYPWWSETGLNRRRQALQACALPAELPNHIAVIICKYKLHRVPKLLLRTSFRQLVSSIQSTRVTKLLHLIWLLRLRCSVRLSFPYCVMGSHFRF